MDYRARSLRTFLGAKDFEESIEFYREIGFEEHPISKNLTLFKITETQCFYLQDYYVKQWVNNTMMFLEVEDVEECYLKLQNLGLHDKYKYVRLTPPKTLDWGKECFIHDPSGILWHFGEFKM